MKKNYFLCFFIAISFFAKAQIRTGTTLLINTHYGFAASGADLGQRFGNCQHTGLGIEWMSNRKSWIVGADGSFVFGKNVKENPIEKLYNVETFIYGVNKELAIIFLRERGFLWQGYVGKLIKIHPTNARAGLRVTAGAGYMQHRIRLQDDQESISQISGDYKKGYDRLTGGLMFTQFIGYQYLSRNRRINFSVGFEFNEGFTKSLRDWNFDTKSKDTAQRFDLLYGLRTSLVLPLYFGDTAEHDEY
jgi:hypothetical protein